MKDIIFVIPCFNAEKNIPSLIASLQAQNDPGWKAIFIDDLSVDRSVELLRSLSDDRLRVIANVEKKFALRNIVETVRTYASDSIIAIIDGDDELCNEHTVRLLHEAHAQPGVVAWTAHRWDINGLNISKEMSQKVNPYQYPWCASHLKTFDATLLNQISDSNFKDHLSRWFERGYDQALMLPLLAKAKKRTYIPDVCYLYKINSCSIANRDWTEMKQLRTINLVRARGFLDAAQ